MQLLSVYVNECGSFDQPTVVLWCFLRQDSRIRGRIVDDGVPAEVLLPVEGEVRLEASQASA